MRFKEGVIWENMHPQVINNMAGVEAVHQKMGVEAIVTSGRDGKHKTGSLHYEGKAFDLRTYHVIEKLAANLRLYLGKEWDVIVEKDHIHIELDEKHNNG